MSQQHLFANLLRLVQRASSRRPSSPLRHLLSNHYHLIVTDVEGQLPIFTEELNKLLARALNCPLDAFRDHESMSMDRALVWDPEA